MEKNVSQPELIQSGKKRSEIFRKRRKGLLKKAVELAKMCGIQISMIFTDTNHSIHYFSNTAFIKIKTNRKFVNNYENFSIYSYNERDYPFNKVKLEEKRMKGEYSGLIQKARDTLKRQQWVELQGLSEKVAYEGEKSKLLKTLTKSAADNLDRDGIFHQSKFEKSSKSDLTQYFMRYENSIPENLIRTALYTPPTIVVQKLFNVDFSQSKKLGFITPQLRKTINKFYSNLDNHIMMGELNSIVSMIFLKTCVMGYYGDTKKNDFLIYALQKIPLEEFAYIIDLSSNGYFSSKETPEFLDFAQNTETSSNFSFNSFSWLSMKPGEKNSGAQESEGGDIQIEEEFKNKIKVLNNVLIMILLGKVKPDDNFSFKVLFEKLKPLGGVKNHFMPIKERILEFFYFLAGAGLHTFKELKKEIITTIKQPKRREKLKKGGEKACLKEYMKIYTKPMRIATINAMMEVFMQGICLICIDNSLLVYKLHHYLKPQNED